jgi:hypothetical protein
MKSDGDKAAAQQQRTSHDQTVRNCHHCPPKNDCALRGEVILPRTNDAMMERRKRSNRLNTTNVTGFGQQMLCSMGRIASLHLVNYAGNAAQPAIEYSIKFYRQLKRRIRVNGLRHRITVLGIHLRGVRLHSRDKAPKQAKMPN